MNKRNAWHSLDRQPPWPGRGVERIGLTKNALRGVLTAAAICLAALQPASAADTVAAGNVNVGRGGSAVLTVEVDSAQPLTLLSLDLSFDGRLCKSLRKQTLRKAGRASAEPQEGGIRCPDEGRVSIVLMDLLGKAAVPAGSGPVAQWSFHVSSTARPGNYPVAVTVRQASNGPAPVALTAANGSITVKK